MTLPNFDPVSKSDFRARVQNNFTAANLTLISIIEGVTFGILLSKVFPEIKQNPTFSNPILPYAFISWTTIILVFYYYSWFVSAVYALPNFREALIPIALATAQVLPMFFLDAPSWWWLFFAVFCGVSAFAFHNTLRSLHPASYTNDFQRGYSLTRRELRADVALSLAVTVIAVIVSIAHSSTNLDSQSVGSVVDCTVLGIVFSLMGLMVAKSQRFYLTPLFQDTSLLQGSPAVGVNLRWLPKMLRKHPFLFAAGVVVVIVDVTVGVLWAASDGSRQWYEPALFVFHVLAVVCGFPDINRLLRRDPDADELAARRVLGFLEAQGLLYIEFASGNPEHPAACYGKAAELKHGVSKRIEYLDRESRVYTEGTRIQGELDAFRRYLEDHSMAERERETDLPRDQQEDFRVAVKRLRRNMLSHMKSLADIYDIPITGPLQEAIPR
jgi:hypothetical protein